MSVERGSLSEILKETQEARNDYRHLKIANLWGKLVENSTNTKTKRIGGFAGMMGVVVLSMILDGNFAIATAETLAVLGGATVGEKIPLLSGPTEFIKEKKAVKIVREKKDVSPEEIADLLSGFSGVWYKTPFSLSPQCQRA